MPFSKEETQDGSRSQGQLPRCGLYGTCGHTQEARGGRIGDMEKNKAGIKVNALVYPKTKTLLTTTAYYYCTKRGLDTKEKENPACCF